MRSLERLKPILNFGSSPWLYLSLLLCVLLFPFMAGFYPIVRFPEEQIDIEVYPDHIWVKGIYAYKNPFPFPVVQGFSIPFPVDSDHPVPVLVSAEQLSPEKRPIPLRYILGKHRFDLTFKAKEKINVRVKYRQHSPIKNARYILITTKPWQRPLKQGRYRLFPKGVRITSSNYMLVPGKTKTFCFEKENFMPEYDWEFSWEAMKS